MHLDRWWRSRRLEGYHRVPEIGTPEMVRGPSPRPLGGARALPSEVVLEPDDVVELGRRNLHQLGPLDRLVSVDPAGGNVSVLARSEPQDLDGPRGVLERPPGPT